MADRIKSFIIILLIILLVALGVKYQIDTNSLNVVGSEQQHLIEEVKATSHSLKKELDIARDANLALEDLIAATKAKPAEIRYITKVETKLVASESVKEFTLLPEKYNFELANGLRVADFEAKDTYKFTTYDLSFRNTLVITDKKTTSLLEVKSSYDDQWIETPHELLVNNSEKAYTLFQPRLVLGAELELPIMEPQAMLGVSFVHPSELVSVGVATVGIGHSVSLGVYPIAINIGKPLPLMTNLYLGAGPTINTKLEPSIALGLYTEL